jgi:uncharacterized protein with GYD domain
VPHYLIQVAYSSEGWKALVTQPQNRVDAVRPAVEKLGGKIESAWFTFGDYDVVLIVQMPSNVDAGAIAMAFAAGGACKAVKTTLLLTVDEAVEAMKKAAGSEYRAEHPDLLGSRVDWRRRRSVCGRRKNSYEFECNERKEHEQVNSQGP